MHNHDNRIDWGVVQAWIQTGIMFLMGLYLIDLTLPGGKLGNYINTSNFGWLTLGGGCPAADPGGFQRGGTAARQPFA